MMDKFLLWQGIIGVVGGILLFLCFYFGVVAYVRKHHLPLVSDWTELLLFIVVVGGSSYTLIQGISNITRAVTR